MCELDTYHMALPEGLSQKVVDTDFHVGFLCALTAKGVNK